MKDIQFIIKENKQEVEGIFRLTLSSSENLPNIKAGQFLHLEVPDNSLILRRPFCIYDVDGREVVTYYAVVGKGTTCLSQAEAGTRLKAILPLGNGFDISAYSRIGLLGGGLGCAELFKVTKTKGKEFYAYLGFANKDRLLFLDDFRRTTTKLTVCTYDGSYAEKGSPLDFLLAEVDKLDVILLCGGPRLVKEAAAAFKDIDIPVLVSMEQRMGCGVGACLVCTCAVKDGDSVKNKRVCEDGPVFNLKDVVV